MLVKPMIISMLHKHMSVRIYFNDSNLVILIKLEKHDPLVIKWFAWKTSTPYNFYPRSSWLAYLSWWWRCF